MLACCPGWPKRLLPEEASQTRSSPSALPPATCLPSWEKATALLRPSTFQRWISLPVVVSQSPSVPSNEQVATSLPLGAKAALRTVPPCFARILTSSTFLGLSPPRATNGSVGEPAGGLGFGFDNACCPNQ